MLNFHNEEDDDEEDEEEDDEVDEENDDDVGLEYLQKPVDELEVRSVVISELFLIFIQEHYESRLSSPWAAEPKWHT